MNSDKLSLKSRKWFNDNWGPHVNPEALKLLDFIEALELELSSHPDDHAAALYAEEALDKALLLNEEAGVLLRKIQREASLPLTISHEIDILINKMLSFLVK